MFESKQKLRSFLLHKKGDKKIIGFSDKIIGFYGNYSFVVWL